MASRAKKLLEFEGLRGTACLGVVLCHAIECGILPVNNQNFGFLAPLIKGGTNGLLCVVIFWILSAIVVTQGYFNAQDKKNLAEAREYLIKSGIKRYPRLAIPALASTIITSLMIWTNLIDINSAREWLKPDTIEASAVFRTQPLVSDPIIDSLYVAFFGGWRANLEGTGPVLWTMGPELMGSLLIFTILFFVPSRRITVTIAAFAFIFTLCILRGLWIPSFMIGLLISIQIHSQLTTPRSTRLINSLSKHSHAFFIASAASVYFVGLGFDGRIGRIITIIAALIIVIATSFCPGFKKFFILPPLVYIGKISFGIYLLHLPIIYSTGFSLRHQSPHNSDLVFAWIPFLAVAVQTIVMAHLFTTFIDTRSQTLSNNLSRLVLGLIIKRGTAK